MTKHSDLIYDVGMHKGEDTDYYLKKGFRVIAFEANPHLINFCKQRFKDKIESNKLKIIEGAILDPSATTKTQTVAFYKNHGLTEWGTVMKNWANRNESLGTSNEIIDVPVINFIHCLNDYGIPHYLKIDIEGMDFVCLESLINFKNKPDFISIESEKISFKKLRREMELLKSLGYNDFKVVNQEDVTSQKEPADSKEGSNINYEFIKGASGLFGNDLPGNWISLNEAIKRYQIIFLGYKIFGDYGLLRKFKYREFIKQKISERIGTKVPGWYDTHAKHSSVSVEIKQSK